MIKNNSYRIKAVTGVFLEYSKETEINESIAKMMVRMVLSDRYRITKEKFQYKGVEI